MRISLFYCLLLASFAVASPNGRHKRHLSYLKNLVNSAIFGRSKINIQPQTDVKEENGYKVFRIPGYDDIVIKVSPKKPVLEEFVYPASVEKVNLNTYGSVVGTKTKEDLAMKEVNNLLSNGFFYGGHNNVMKETVVPMFPSLNTRNYVVQEKIETAPVIKERPVLKEVIESRPVLKEVVETRPVLTEFVENRPVLEEVIETKPMFTEVIRPLEERVELKVPFEPTYSYKEMQDNEAVLTYTAHYNPGVELLETLKTKTELPMCIKKRVDEAIVLGADPNRFAPVQEVYQYQSQPVVDFSYPRIEANSFVQSADSSWFAPVQELNQHQTAPFIDFSYPSADTNSYVQNSFSEDVADYGFSPHRVRPLKDSPVRYNLGPRKTQAINPRPVPLHSDKSLHFEADINDSKDKVNSQTRKVQAFNYFGEKVDIAQTLGPIPPQYIIHVDNKTGHVAESNKKIIKAVPIVGSKDIIANAKIPVNVYKSQRNPNTGELVKETMPLSTNVKTSFNKYIATQTSAAEKDNAQVKNVAESNKKIMKAVPIVNSKGIIANAKIPVNVYKSQRNPNTGELVKETKPLSTNVETSFNKYIATQTLAAEKDNAQVKNVAESNKKIIKAVPILGSQDIIANAKIPVNVYKSQRNPNTGELVKETKPLSTNVETSFNKYVATQTSTAEEDNAQVKNVAVSNKKIIKAVPNVGSKDIIATAKIPVNVYKSQRNPNTGELVKETKPLRTNVETSFNKYVATQTLAAEKDNAQVKNVAESNKKIIKAVPILGSKDIIANAKIPLNDKSQRNPNTGEVLKETMPLRTNVETSFNKFIATQTSVAEKDNAQEKMLCSRIR